MNLKFMIVTLSLFALGLQGIVLPTFAAQNAAPASHAQDDHAKLQPFWDAFLKAREQKDWGTCLEIAEKCKQYGEEGLKANTFMKFSVFMRSGDEGHVKGMISDLINEGMNYTNDFSDFYENDPKGLRMLDEVLKMLDGQTNNLKLTKLKTLMLGDHPTEYIAYAKTILEGSDQNNAALVNKIAWYIVCPDSESKKEVEGTYRRTPKGEIIQSMGVDDTEFKPLSIYDNLKHPASFKTPAMFALAKKAVDRAIKLTRGKNGDYLDTLGWTYYRLGDIQKASETEAKAAIASKDDFGSSWNGVSWYQLVSGWFKTQR